MVEQVNAVRKEAGEGDMMRMQGGGMSLVEREEIEMSIATAKKYPREISVCVKNMESMALMDAQTAESCFYALPRGGRTIFGPSVRLAEIAVMSWGNIAASAEIIGEDEDWVYAVGMCRDLQNNTLSRIKVRRRIRRGVSADQRRKGVTKGARFDTDMIAVTGMAACAIAYRNSVYKVIPSSIVNNVFNKCKQVAVGDAASFANKRIDVVQRLAKMGIEEERVLKRLECKRVEDIDGDDLAVLIGLGTAVHQGETTLDKAFPAVKKESSEGDKKKKKKKADEPVRGKVKKVAEPESQDEPVKEPEVVLENETPPTSDSVNRDEFFSDVEDDSTVPDVQEEVTPPPTTGRARKSVDDLGGDDETPWD